MPATKGQHLALPPLELKIWGGVVAGPLQARPSSLLVKKSNDGHDDVPSTSTTMSVTLWTSRLENCCWFKHLFGIICVCV